MSSTSNEPATRPQACIDDCSSLLTYPTYLTYLTYPTYLTCEPIDVHAERNAARCRGGVRAKHSFDDYERLIVFRKPAAFGGGLRTRLARPLLEGDTQRRPPCTLPGVGGQERAAHEKRRDDDCGEPPAARGPPRPPRKRGARNQKRAGEIAREVGNEETKHRAAENADRWNSRDVPHGAPGCKSSTGAPSQRTQRKQRTQRSDAEGVLPLCPLKPSVSLALFVSERAQNLSELRPSRSQFLRSNPAAPGPRGPAAAARGSH